MILLSLGGLLLVAHPKSGSKTITFRQFGVSIFAILVFIGILYLLTTYLKVEVLRIEPNRSLAIVLLGVILNLWLFVSWRKARKRDE